MLIAGQSDRLNAHIHLLLTDRLFPDPVWMSKPECPLMLGVDDCGATSLDLVPEISPRPK